MSARDAARPAVGLDVGGTKVAGVLLGGDGAVLATREAPMPATDAEHSVAAVIELGRRLTAGAGEIVGVGVGAPGLVDHGAGVLRFAPNLPWRDVPLAARLGKALGAPVTVDNDANAAAWGEFRFGAGRGRTDMLMVTVGTGIGGGIVSAGRLLRGAHGFAAEIGHVIVEPGGPRCGCGNRGCWEQVASGNALGRLGREAARNHPSSPIARLAGSADAVTGVHVAEAAAEGDEIALHIFEEVGRRLGEGIAGLVNVLDPDVVVLGGGVAESGELILAPARQAFSRAVEAPAHRPEVPIVPAELGNDAGAMGAAALVFEDLA